MIIKKALQVEDSLSRHETDRCMEWIMDNKSKLRRLKSNFEVTVRIQECVELVRKGLLNWLTLISILFDINADFAPQLMFFLWI